jgi:hypothetical protein
VRLGRGVIVAGGVVVALAALALIVSSSFGRPASRTEVGVVIAVEAVSLTDVRAFTIRTADGRTIVFRVGVLENGAEFPPGHLGEHQATAAPIRVTYRDDGGEHVAIRLEDSPAAAPS